ncbi:hypothetical protein, partial [Segatella hominis]|uniref:hypothetical protein n=1 Tax=Segatella hominis TaxID=2518605 RepID=UPI003AABB510
YSFYKNTKFSVSLYIYNFLLTMFNFERHHSALQEYNFYSKIETFKVIFRVIGLKGYKKLG